MKESRSRQEKRPSSRQRVIELETESGKEKSDKKSVRREERMPTESKIERRLESKQKSNERRSTASKKDVMMMKEREDSKEKPRSIEVMVSDGMSSPSV